MPNQYADDALLLALFPFLQQLQRASWRVTVLSSADGDYAITANDDPDYAATALGDTPNTLRGKLKTAVNTNSLIITAAANLSTELILKEVKAGNVTALSVDPEAALELEVIQPSDATAALRAAWLEATQNEISLCAWGDKASLGHAALAAAYISLVMGIDPNTGLSMTNVERMKLGPAEIAWGTGGSGSKSVDDMLANNGAYLIYLAQRGSLPMTPITDLSGVCC